MRGFDILECVVGQKRFLPGFSRGKRPAAPPPDFNRKGKADEFHVSAQSRTASGSVRPVPHPGQAAGKAFHGKSGGPRRAGFAASGAGHPAVSSIRSSGTATPSAPAIPPISAPDTTSGSASTTKAANARHREHLRLQRPFRGSYRAQLGRGRGGQPRPPASSTRPSIS